LATIETASKSGHCWLTLRLGGQGSVYDLLGEEAPIDYLSAEEITARLRQRFVASFRSTASVA
jgi:hypothetical protein